MTESDMTEFEELERIESAIESKNNPELQWAIEYCKMKVQNATRKDRLKILAQFRKDRPWCL